MNGIERTLFIPGFIVLRYRTKSGAGTTCRDSAARKTKRFAKISAICAARGQRPGAARGQRPGDTYLRASIEYRLWIGL